MKAGAVICGGGLMGLSVAYHLARRGALVYLFEKEWSPDQPNSACVGTNGNSRISIGTLATPMFYSDTTSQLLARHSHELYANMASTSESFRVNACGRVYMANTPVSEMQLRRLVSRLRITNPKAEFIDSPGEIASRWPIINTDDLKCAVYSPDDKSVNMLDLCDELANLARDAGAHIFECCNVRRVFLSDNQRVYAVDTDKGLVETSNFVNASGIWSNSVLIKDAPDEGIRVPAHPCIHTFLITKGLPNMSIDETTPLFIDIDDKIYVGPTGSRTLCGGFGKDDSPALHHASMHDSTADWVMPCPEWDNFHPVLQRLLNRCPSLANLPHGDLVSGAELYTPDMSPIVGESAQVKGYYFANGFNGQGLTMAGGMGKILANWIVDGETKGIDVSRLDATRFLSMHVNPQYLYERVPEVASNIFINLHVTHQCQTARNLRMSPVHYQLKAAGAVFGEVMGYERPLWYHHPTSTSEKLEGGLFTGQDTLLGRPTWFSSVMKEYEACRERVGLLDMTSFAKFDVSGPDAVRLLQSICSANVDKPIGTTIYTGMQDDHGGYVTDCTMSRTRENAYFIVAPTVQQVRLALWLRRWIDEWKMDVKIQDVTGLYTALNVVGPSSRYLMHDITGKSMTSVDFPSFTYRELEVGMADGIRAISVTHCGELGWVLYIPNEMAQNVYDRIVEAGAEYSFQHAGYYTLRHLRIEKFYVYWGQDISSCITPIECGRSFRVDFNKEFIGKKALLRQLDVGVNRRFVQLLVDKHKMNQDPWPQGGEPIFCDNKLAGWTTSAAYGFTLGTQVCLGYIENEDFGVSQEYLNNGAFQIEIAGKRFPVRLNYHSPSLPMISSEHPHHYRPTQR